MKFPHKKKLTALFNNTKLPSSDKVRENEVLEKYQQWISALNDKNILI